MLARADAFSLQSDSILEVAKKEAISNINYFTNLYILILLQIIKGLLFKGIYDACIKIRVFYFKIFEIILI
jgi:hypothetical protein